MKFIRFTALLSALFLFLSALCLGSLAADESYTVSKSYKDSKYYENLKAVPLSGDGVRDVLAVALSQLGYHEGNGEGELDGLNPKGNRDFVEYNVLYGKLDNDQGNGLSYGYYWCASFVNWCLRQAGIELDASCGGKVSCWKWLEAFEDAGRYRDKGAYLPAPGDIIFFKDSETYVRAGHIGFVLYRDENKVYTIEGNTSGESEYSSDGDCVAIKSYPLASSYIVGYGLPDYEKKELFPLDYSGRRATAGLYISSEDIECYSSPVLDGKSEILESFRVFEVAEIEGSVYTLRTVFDGEERTVYASLAGKVRQLTSTGRSSLLTCFGREGEELWHGSYTKDTELTLPTLGGLEDAGFVGWSDRRGGDLISGSYKLVGDCTLYSVWDETVYEIVFRTPEGKLISKMSGFYGERIKFPSYTPPNGYSFKGWSADSDLMTVTGNAEYTAVLEKSCDTEPGGCSGAVISSWLPIAAVFAVLISVKRKETQ